MGSGSQRFPISFSENQGKEYISFGDEFKMSEYYWKEDYKFGQFLLICKLGVLREMLGPITNF